jgi:hypothetical protein
VEIEHGLFDNRFAFSQCRKKASPDNEAFLITAPAYAGGFDRDVRNEIYIANPVPRILPSRFSSGGSEVMAVLARRRV